MEKRYRRIEYTNADKKVCSGYSSETSSLFQPFALYIRNIFGDGIYYSKDKDEFNYLLVIHKGEVISGTDVFINRALFERYRQHLLSSDYATLQWNCLSMAHVDQILEANRRFKLNSNKKKMMFISVICGIGILCFLLFAVALKLFLLT